MPAFALGLFNTPCYSKRLVQTLREQPCENYSLPRYFAIKGIRLELFTKSCALRFSFSKLARIILRLRAS